MHSANAKRSILVVEDNGLIALQLKSVLEEAGYKVVGPYPDLKKALDQLATGNAIDAGVLDVNLGEGQNVYPLAKELRLRNVPFVFVTGYNSGAAIDPDYRDIQCVEKPVDEELLKQRISAMIAN